MIDKLDISPENVARMLEWLRSRKKCVGFKSGPSDDGGHMALSAQYEPDPQTNEAADMLEALAAKLAEVEAEAGKMLAEADSEYNGKTSAMIARHAEVVGTLKRRAEAAEAEVAKLREERDECAVASGELIPLADHKLAVAEAYPPERIWEFDRYINGVLMAEGVTITQANTLEQACIRAVRLASGGRNGEVPILVLRTGLSAAKDDLAALEALRAIGDKMAASIEGNYYIPGIAAKWRSARAALEETKP